MRICRNGHVPVIRRVYGVTDPIEVEVCSDCSKMSVYSNPVSEEVIAQ